MREELRLRLRYNIEDNILIIRFRDGIVASSRKKERMITYYDENGSIVGYEIRGFFKNR